MQVEVDEMHVDENNVGMPVGSEEALNEIDAGIARAGGIYRKSKRTRTPRRSLLLW